MSTKLYVGGLSYSTTEDELREYFSQAGNITSVAIIIDKMSGRSKGFGFVEMSTEDEANSAISMFNGKEFGGRTLTVNEAKPQEDRPRNNNRFGGNRGGFGGGRRFDDRR